MVAWESIMGVVSGRTGANRDVTKGTIASELRKVGRGNNVPGF